jgi:ATP-dependent protease Clp ATPase subunit
MFQDEGVELEIRRIGFACDRRQGAARKTVPRGLRSILEQVLLT